jgi:oxysterol-binding protein-related protein 9/10/11
MMLCIAYWGERPALFAAIADGPTEEERHLRVTKWFIVSKPGFGQYGSRSLV